MAAACDGGFQAAAAHGRQRTCAGGFPSGSSLREAVHLRCPLPVRRRLLVGGARAAAALGREHTYGSSGFLRGGSWCLEHERRRLSR